MWATNPQYCISSGDFFAFVRGETIKFAVESYMLDIMGVKHGTLGLTIGVRKDYDSKEVLKVYDTERVLKLFFSQREHLGLEMKYEIRDQRIHFHKTPFGRRSRHEAWERFYWIGEKMVKLDEGHWIQSAFRINPFEKVAALQKAEPVLAIIKNKIEKQGYQDKDCIDTYGISTMRAESRRCRKDDTTPVVIVYVKNDPRIHFKLPRTILGYRIDVRI